MHLQDNIEMYRLTQRIPQGCVPPVCDFFLGISNNKQNSSFIDITLEARANGWVAVGFSKTQNMVSYIASEALIKILIILVSQKLKTWSKILNFIEVFVIHNFVLQLSADVFGCTVYSDGHVAAIDTWNPSTTKTNVLDNDQVSLLNNFVILCSMITFIRADGTVSTGSGV